jgi:hypothetical protein
MYCRKWIIIRKWCLAKLTFQLMLIVRLQTFTGHFYKLNESKQKEICVWKRQIKFLQYFLSNCLSIYSSIHFSNFYASPICLRLSIRFTLLFACIFHLSIHFFIFYVSAHPIDFSYSRSLSFNLFPSSVIFIPSNWTSSGHFCFFYFFIFSFFHFFIRSGFNWKV